MEIPPAVDEMLTPAFPLSSRFPLAPVAVRLRSAVSDSKLKEFAPVIDAVPALTVSPPDALKLMSLCEVVIEIVCPATRTAAVAVTAMSPAVDPNAMLVPLVSCTSASELTVIFCAALMSTVDATDVTITASSATSAMAPPAVIATSASAVMLMSDPVDEMATPAPPFNKTPVLDAPSALRTTGPLAASR